jgi:predicted Zn-dependent protease
MAVRKRIMLAWAAAPLALLQSASVGSQQVAPISRQEAQMGAQYHPQFVAEFGGAMTGPHAQYVEQVGKKIALQSGLANAESAFTVTLLNSPVHNAFAVPGGYVYSTRQLVTLMNNEAELAGVMGHEVGHVAARHSQRRQRAATRNSIFGLLGAIGSSIFLGNSAAGELLTQGFLQGSQMLTLSFSRKQELEADDLGIAYLSRAGYDPRAMSTVLASLAAQNALDARIQGRNASVPEWASTHPDPASRVRTAATKAQGFNGSALNRDTFLTRIDGLLYGDDPEQGVIEGSRFTHPEMMLSFTAPQGFTMINSPRAVSINGQGGQAQLSMAAYNGNLDTYVQSAFAALGGQNSRLAPQNVQRTTINGLPAAIGTARVNNNNGQVDVTLVAYEFARDRAYHFAAITPVGRAAVFNPMFSSMRRITQAEAGAVVPRRIQVVTVARGDTVASLARRMDYPTAQVERFRVLNALGGTEEVVPGQRVKLVVRGR